jgi:serine/threonine protein phosphatase PrpC
MLHRAGEIRDDEIRHHPDRGRLIQALGQEGEPRATVSDAHMLQAGEAFLLCSDGWWENVSDEEMERSLEASAGPQEWLEHMAATITAAASDPQDNYTATATFVATTRRR